MNASDRPPHLGATRVAPLLRVIVLAALAEPGGATAAEPDWLRAQAALAGAATLADWHRTPPPDDARLHALGRAFGLADAELVALALAAGVEIDPMLGRVLAWLQAPTGGARPTIGLVLTLAEQLGIDGALQALVDGPARACGLLLPEDEKRPLPEQALLVPVPTVLALHGAGGTWPGVRLDAVPLRDGAPASAPSLRAAAVRQAAALRDPPSAAGLQALAVRSGHPREARAAAALVAAELGGVPAFIEGEPPRGLAPWLWLRAAVPVVCAELAPGETRRLPELPGHRGALLLATGVDGSFEHEGDPVGSWRVPLPLPHERVVLWQAHLPPDAAEQIGRAHRQAPAHIAHLARAARHQARLAGDEVIEERHVKLAARQGAAGELGTLAQLLPDDVADEALVMAPELRAAVDALRQRCLLRECLADRLGPSSRTRYRPGVKALLVGASGTGKTLAVAWLACRLGLPLYRVDLASVASKYIGETEKNLAQLFARAEHAEVVLLFDEADSLFGKRTDVKDANDRFANQQTNYLLQRIETFDGIAVLTSNSRARFDSAFTRRLDAIIEFPAPGPQERRALWLAHLGGAHRLDVAQVNRIAASCDLAGGHIRNATLASAATAGPQPIGYEGLCAAIEAEYRKLGRQMPAGL
jgi:ATPase family associated with various cellular activities (AAA)